jgi:hypothetical protein
LCALLLTGLLTGAAPGEQPVRAMWVWTAEEPARLVDWATRHDVTALFVYFEPAADIEPLRELKRRCDEAGITLDALGGEPAWALDHAAALAWRDAVDRLGVFHGRHLDVEPYLLPQWTTDRDAVVRSFLTLLDRMGGSGRLEVDVPFWYGTIPAPGGRDLAGEVFARVDAVTVMSYRDTAGAIVDVGRDTLRRATKPARLAAETRPTPDCARCSFHGTSQRHLRAVLAEAEAAARRFPAYAGIAVHDYRSWSELRG